MESNVQGQITTQTHTDSQGRELPLITLAELPVDRIAWGTYRKMALTRAIKMSGPFAVETSESDQAPFVCDDGYLAMDARGYPYAIATEEFEQIYKPDGEAVPVDPAPAPGEPTVAEQVAQPATVGTGQDDPAPADPPEGVPAQPPTPEEIPPAPEPAVPEPVEQPTPDLRTRSEGDGGLEPSAEPGEPADAPGDVPG